jgi:uncharacterized protein (DUF1800 family)
MTADRRREAALALHRFGFGPAPDSIAAISADPRGATLADLERQGAGQVAAANLLPSAATARALFDFRAERQAQEKLAQRAKKAADADGTAPTMSDVEGAAVPPLPKPENKQPPLPQQLLEHEASVRLAAAVHAEVGFVERLVWFWSNHFCVSAEGQRGGRPLRARGDPAACARPLRRYARSGRKPPGDAVLPRQRRIDGSGLDRRHHPRQRFERKSCARNS